MDPQGTICPQVPETLCKNLMGQCTSLIPRPSLAPVFDCNHKLEGGKGLGMRLPQEGEVGSQSHSQDILI